MRNWLKNTGLAAIVGLAGLVSGCGDSEDSDLSIDDKEYGMKPAAVKPVEEFMKSIVFVVDTSGSMKEELEGKEKMQSAREALAEMWGRMQVYNERIPNIEAGLIYFVGEQAETLVKLKPFDHAELSGKLQYLLPQAGTPLGRALTAAERMLDENATGQRYIVMLTDGQNQNGEGPVRVYRLMKKTNVAVGDSHTKLVLVSYGLKEGTFDELKKEGAIVYEARNAKDLADIFKNIEVELEGK